MGEPMVLGIDLGGTHMRVAVVDSNGEILRLGKIHSNIHLGARQACLRLISECRMLMDEARSLGGSVFGIGMGVAGKIDRHRGEVVFSPNLPAINGYLLGIELEKSLGLPVVMENDANAFGIGENWVGSGRGIANWVGVTLGTGVGGCLVFGGELWRGDDLGFVGEIGHMIVDPQGPSCACGLQGCLEAHSSAGSLMRAVEKAATDGLLSRGPLHDRWVKGALTAEGVYLSAKEGDPGARRLFHRMGWALGIALAGLFTVLGIRHAVIGGGVSAAWDEFIGPLRSSLAEHSSFLASEEMMVLRGALGDNAALLGAAKLAWKSLCEKEATSEIL